MAFGKFYMQDAEDGLEQARWFGSSCQPCKTGTVALYESPPDGLV